MTKTFVPNAERISAPYMTKFEYWAIIGQRAAQLERGVPANIEIPPGLIPKNGMIDWIKVAEAELLAHKVPMIVVRPLPREKGLVWERWNIYENPDTGDICELCIKKMDIPGHHQE